MPNLSESLFEYHFYMTLFTIHFFPHPFFIIKKTGRYLSPSASTYWSCISASTYWSCINTTTTALINSYTSTRAVTFRYAYFFHYFFASFLNIFFRTFCFDYYFSNIFKYYFHLSIPPFFLLHSEHRAPQLSQIKGSLRWSQVGSGQQVPGALFNSRSAVI